MCGRTTPLQCTSMVLLARARQRLWNPSSTVSVSATMSWSSRGAATKENPSATSARQRRRFSQPVLSQLPVRQIRALIPDDGALLAEIFPVLASVIDTESATTDPILDLQERRRRAVFAFRTLLSRLASRVRLVILIDDLQWGHLDSALLISELLHQPGAPSLLLLATYRSEDADTSPCLRALLDAPPTAGVERRQLSLEPLSHADARQLAFELLDDVSPESRATAASIARESRGSPSFVDELVAYLHGGEGLTDLSSLRTDSVPLMMSSGGDCSGFPSSQRTCSKSLP